MWRHRSGRRRRRRFDAEGRRRRRRLVRLGGAVGALGAVLAVVGVLAASDLLRARAQLEGARSTLEVALNDPSVLGTAEGRAATISAVDGAVASVGSARRRVEGSPALSALGSLPGLRTQRAGLLSLIDDSAGAADSGRRLLGAIDRLAATNQLRDGVLPLDGLVTLQTEIRAAGEAIGERASGADGLWGPLGRSRREFDAIARSSGSRLTEGADAVGAARTFLGATGPRRYFVALSNNAEMRAQGAVLSYVVTSFVDGRVSFERSGSIADIQLTAPAPTPIPPGTREVFGSLQPTTVWQSVNATPDFAFSGRAMVDMYRQATGQRLDGVIGLDVPALAGFLRIIGPVAIEGVSEPIGADNVGRVLLNDLYAGLGPTSDQTVRRERQGEVVRAVIDRLTTGSRDVIGLGRELGRAAAGGHLRLWSPDAAEEEVFERTGLGGGPAVERADRTFHLAVQNRTASKLDYFVQTSVRQDVHLTDGGTAVVRTTVLLENRAPTDGTPSYQLGPLAATGRPGDYLAWVLLWGPAGSVQSSGGVEESGLNLSQRIVDVTAAGKREVVFTTVMPDAVRDGRAELRLVPQPRLEPVALEVRFTAEGWKVSGPAVWQGAWDRVLTLGWDVRR